MKKENSKIDVVVLWVDGDDPAWLAEKSKYDGSCNVEGDSANSAQRFRDWGLMRYWFRGIEKNMPFINKIFFITWGHVPEWLDTDNEKLVIVNHRDYIPEKYLPTYNSDVIELNLHRIEELSENFILFNDDFFPIAPAKEEMFFKNDQRCDMLLSEITYNFNLNSLHAHIRFNDLGIINKYFGEHRRGLKDIPKWLSPCYGFKNVLTNLNKLPFKRIMGFKDQHLCLPHKKSTFKKMWELEYDVLDRSCMNKFRSPLEVNHWLMRYWSFMTREFVPYNVNKIGLYTSFATERSLDYICYKIREHEKPILVINDTIDSSDEEQFLRFKNKITAAFEEIFPEKCSFEKDR